MKQIAQQTHVQLLTLIMASVASVAFAAAAVAAEGDAQAGGAAGAHMSPAGSANSDAQWQDGATQGADRAAQQMNATGAEQKQSGDADAGKAAAKTKRPAR